MVDFRPVCAFLNLSNWKSLESVIAKRYESQFETNEGAAKCCSSSNFPVTDQLFLSVLAYTLMVATLLTVSNVQDINRQPTHDVCSRNSTYGDDGT